MRVRTWLSIPMLLALVVTTNVAHSELTIEITQGVEGALPIAVVPFATQGSGARPPEDVGQIIADDLRRSGRFSPIPLSDLPQRPADERAADYALWQATGAEGVVLGSVETLPDGRYRVTYQLLDSFQKIRIEELVYTVDSQDLRRLAHHISDRVFERLNGSRGAFSTRIAYVTGTSDMHGPIYTLMVADADGHSPSSIVRSREPIMSPAWSPDGERLAYVSFESGKPQIFIQEVYSGRREVVSDWPGINGAPSWSPDGKRLALTLSRDGNPEIYTLDIATRQLRRLTENVAIDTEPVWTPDGGAIIFTSDRGGSPQLYRVGTLGGDVQRLTYEGEYNARASISPDGRLVAMVHRFSERFQIALFDLEQGTTRILTNGSLDESPSFAPNGAMILYASTAGGQDFLAAVSVDGMVRQRLQLDQGDVREPAWSPFVE